MYNYIYTATQAATYDTIVTPSRMGRSTWHLTSLQPTVIISTTKSANEDSLYLDIYR